MSQSRCPTCDGKGKDTFAKNPPWRDCKTCNGTGTDAQFKAGEETMNERIKKLLNDTRRNYAYPEAMPCDEYEDAMKAGIKQLITEAKIEELKYIAARLDEPALALNRLENRLAELKGEQHDRS